MLHISLDPLSYLLGTFTAWCVMLWSFNTFQVVKCCWHNDLIIVNIQTGFVLVYFSGRWLAFSLGWLQYSFLSLTKTLAWQALVAWWCDMVSRSVDVDSISSLAIRFFLLLWWIIMLVLFFMWVVMIFFHCWCCLFSCIYCHYVVGIDLVWVPVVIQI